MKEEKAAKPSSLTEQESEHDGSSSTEMEKLKQELQQAKAGEVKLYSVLKRVATELKTTKNECQRYKVALKNNNNGGKDKNNITATATATTHPNNGGDAQKPSPPPPTMSSTRAWYDGGMWRGPELLPGIQERTPEVTASADTEEGGDSSGDGTRGLMIGRNPISLTDLFLDLVIVTAFTRVGVAVKDRGTIDGPILAYFIVFWLIWGKDASFSTRFDTTDLSSQLTNLLTCFAVLFGSLSSTAPFESGDGTRIMVVALFVAILHFGLHSRVWFWFRETTPSNNNSDGNDDVSNLYAVKIYAEYIMILTFLESVTWCIGIFILPETSKYRWVIFLVAILLSFRVPRTFLANDFHAACSKRGVLFILLLGFMLQNVVLVATPFFDYQMPDAGQYCYIGLACFLLFTIKLLYVDDNSSLDPADHALLVNRTVGFLFHLGQLALLLSTTILGAGLDLLTHSYLAATIALPDNARSLVCGGFSGVILSIGFIKSMHIRRFPLNPAHKRLFFAAYGTQLVVLLAVGITTLCMSRGVWFGTNASAFGGLNLTEIQMLSVLSFLALLTLVVSWLDEAVEISLYDGQVADARQFRVHPFGLWTSCFSPGMPDAPLLLPEDASHPQLTPLLSSSSMSLFGSNKQLYASLDQGLENTITTSSSDRRVSFDDTL